MNTNLKSDPYVPKHERTKDCRNYDNKAKGYNTKPFYELSEMIDLETGELFYKKLKENKYE